MYSYKVLLQGEEIEFTGETKSEALCKLGLYMEDLLQRRTHRNRTSYVKRRISHELDHYLNEVQAYLRLTGMGICPALFSHDVLFEYKIISERDSRARTFYAYYLEVEHHGVDLAEKFGASCIYYMCKDKPLNKQELALRFPYPQDVQTQIIDLVERMYKAGVYHKDLHSGNMLIKDGVVKIIDFEFCEFED